MPVFVPFFPLAQMNTNIGGANPAATSAAPAATGGTAVPAPAAAPPAVTTAPANLAAATQSATTGTASSTAPATQNAPAADSGWASFLRFAPIILMFVVLYFILFRGQRKEEKRRKSLISVLKKGDQVMTIGGMLARVVSIDGDEVVLKIDESANVKATYRKSAIQEVVTERDDKK